MTKPFFLILLCCALLACDKDSDPPPPPVDLPTDTLSPGWKIISMPQSQNETFSDIFFINNLTGFVVSDSGIYKSADGGNTWQFKYKIKELINISMSSEQNALFVTNYRNGVKNDIVFTHDAGNSFDTTTLNDSELSDVFYTGLNTAYAVGRFFWKTDDNGLSWTNLYDFGSTPGYRSLHFTNENTGWAVGPTGVLYTNDGGQHWQTQNTSPDFVFQANSTCSIFFTDNSTGFVADKTSIGKTTNGGTQWNSVFVASGTYHDLHFLNASEGYLTDFHYIHKTTNGGTTWTKEIILPEKVLIDVHFTDASHGWACGQSGLIMRYEK